MVGYNEVNTQLSPSKRFRWSGAICAVHGVNVLVESYKSYAVRRQHFKHQAPIFPNYKSTHYLVPGVMKRGISRAIYVAGILKNSSFCKMPRHFTKCLTDQALCKMSSHFAK